MNKICLKQTSWMYIVHNCISNQEKNFQFSNKTFEIHMYFNKYLMRKLSHLVVTFVSVQINACDNIYVP